MQENIDPKTNIENFQTKISLNKRFENLLKNLIVTLQTNKISSLYLVLACSSW